MIEINNTELKMLDKAAREFSRKALKPDWEENDQFPYGAFFDSALDKAFEAGFFHTMLPDELGGFGNDITPLCIILHQVCREDASMGGIILTNSVAQELVIAAGSLDLVKDKIDGAESARELLIAYPLFDNPCEIEQPSAIRLKDDRMVITGTTDYVVLGGLATHAILPGRLPGDEDYSFVLVDLNSGDVRKSNPVLSLGLHACPAVDLEFSDLPCQLLGENGKGGEYFQTMSDRMLLAAAAMSAGIMKSSFDEASEYSQQREQGGRKIIKWSEVRMMLATLAYKLKVSEMSISQACRDLQEKSPVWQNSSNAAAIFSLDLAREFTSDGIQLLGGYGYTKDYAQEKRFRDAQQMQAVLGMAPLKKLDYISRVI